MAIPWTLNETQDTTDGIFCQKYKNKSNQKKNQSKKKVNQSKPKYSFNKKSNWCTVDRNGIASSKKSCWADAFERKKSHTNGICDEVAIKITIFFSFFLSWILFNYVLSMRSNDIINKSTGFKTYLIDLYEQIYQISSLFCTTSYLNLRNELSE